MLKKILWPPHLLEMKQNVGCSAGSDAERRNVGGSE
jgi:hypothetical protein